MGIVTSAAMCLALNIYNEARGESLAGQYAVAHVVMNRVAAPNWKNTVCAVVYQHAQFSWTLKRFTVNDEDSLNLAIKVAVDVIDGNYTTELTCADHYYNPNVVNPNWATNMKLDSVIGSHRFLCSED